MKKMIIFEIIPLNEINIDLNNLCDQHSSMNGINGNFILILIMFGAKKKLESSM